MDKNRGAFRKGFTIIEVMLFLALSGLLMAGILGGLGGSLARQRYNDAVEDVVNIFRDQYAFVTNTQISYRSKGEDVGCYGLVTSDFSDQDARSYFLSKSLTTPDNISYRGRTNCVVYGAVTVVTEDYVETTELLGRDFQSILRERGEKLPDNVNDLTILRDYATANNISFRCDVIGSDGAGYSNCYLRAADRTRIQTTKWGTKMQNKDKTQPLQKTLLIFRSPRDGSIRTYVWNGVVTDADGKTFKYSTINENGGIVYNDGNRNYLDRYGINQYLTDDNFKIQDLDICLDSGGNQTYNNARRLIKIQRDGRGQNAVELINLDVEKSDAEGSKLGEQSCGD